jgi:uncharacterized membrane protein
MQGKTYVRKIAFAGIVAAVYAALTLILAPISFGHVQFRIAEALTVLPFFFPITLPGIYVGVIIANLFSPYGILDVVAGSSATLLAGLCTMYIGKMSRDSVALKALACFPPVIFNALIIGAVIAVSVAGGGAGFWPNFVAFGLWVGLGQLVVLYVIGFPLLLYLPKTHLYKMMLEKLRVEN